jgi:hypothetical protein
MQNHTGEHIVSGVIHSLFGYNNVGFHMNDSLVTFDVDGSLTEDDIKKILSPEGTLDQLRDFLDYSPEGGKELIKKLAVEMELPDTRKRKIISEATGFSIDNAINVNAILNAEDAQSKEEEKLARGQRRATPIKESAAPTRRTTPQYKVVTPKN